MRQAVIYFADGTILRSSPMNDRKAEIFAQSFSNNLDVVEMTTVPIEKVEAQIIFRSDAADWKALSERCRGAENFDNAKDSLAVRNYIAAIQVGCSG